MRRSLRREELRLWSMVLADVRPRPGRNPPKAAEEAEEAPSPPSGPKPPGKMVKVAKGPPPVVRPPARPAASVEPRTIEPNRARRIVIGREAIGARLDLHGMTQDQARAALERFVFRASGDGIRAVLVITGKGSSGDGILRRRTPEWLSSPPLRGLVAGISEARHRHGGKGALYVALKRRPG